MTLSKERDRNKSIINSSDFGQAVLIAKPPQVPHHKMKRIEK